MIGDVEVREAGIKGLGLFARRAFDEGELLFRRRHTKVIGSSEIEALSESDRVRLCDLGSDRYGLVAPPGCYVNHSCDPNAMRHGVVVFAWRAIAAGEEITLDYRINALGGSSWPCDCGTSLCTGSVVGSFFAIPLERQALLLPHAPRFVQREHRRRSARL